MKDKFLILCKSIPQLLVMYLFLLGAILLSLIRRFAGVSKTMSRIIKWVSGFVLGLFALIAMVATWIFVALRVYIFRRDNNEF